MQIKLVQRRSRARLGKAQKFHNGKINLFLFLYLSRRREKLTEQEKILHNSLPFQSEFKQKKFNAHCQPTTQQIFTHFWAIWVA